MSARVLLARRWPAGWFQVAALRGLFWGKRPLRGIVTFPVETSTAHPLRPSGHHGGKVALGRPRQLERPVVVSAATWNVADLPARTPGEWHELSGFGLWKAV